MEYYLNERYPYQRNEAIACYYEYADTCILEGKVEERKLIVTKEICFQRKPKEEIAKSLVRDYSWINQNDYFAQFLGHCYCLNFDDEADLRMLTDVFQELKDYDRFSYEAEKTETKNRDKALQILVKALSYALSAPLRSIAIVTAKQEPFRNPFK